MEGSYEQLFHHVVGQMDGLNFADAVLAMVFRSNVPSSTSLATRDCIKHLSNSKIERAIGVVYRPQTERQSHYFHCCLPKQFDAVIHIDTTLALTPLEHHPQWAQGRIDAAPAAYPGITLSKKKVDNYDATSDFSTSDMATSVSGTSTASSRSGIFSSLTSRFTKKM
jgi:hypothetical protein